MRSWSGVSRRSRPFSTSTECPVSRRILLVLAALALIGCPREKRELQSSAPAASRPVRVRISPLQPGQVLPETVQETAYEVNAYQLNEGKRLFEWYNCVGCHAVEPLEQTLALVELVGIEDR